MKAFVKKSILIDHKNTLRIANVGKKVFRYANLKLSVLEKLSIIGPTFSQDIECNCIEKGTISLPYNIWNRLMEGLIHISSDEIEISGKNGEIKFDKMLINNRKIKIIPDVSDSR